MTVYRVQAYNTAHNSENKMHDDTVARQFGFTGGLVPGVDVYAYMTHMPVERWGRAWLERGTADCRFLKPLYDGETATVTATESGDGIDIVVESRGETCATGHAALPSAAAATPAPGAAGPAPPAEAARPQATDANLALGTPLAIHPIPMPADYMAGYLKDVRETLGLYDAEKLVHPGAILRVCNRALTHNVVMGPWIHVGSKVQNLAAARVGAAITVQARVADNYERKGHRFVDLDVLVLADGRTPIAQVLHTAIYRPRQLRAA